MNKLEILRQLVDELYKSDNPNASIWVKWAYPNHVLTVASNAKRLSMKYHADAEKAEIGALLHDIGDVEMLRDSKDFEQRSEQIAEGLLNKAGYDEEEIRFIIDKVIKPHSCHEGDEPPTVIEGKVLATADALAHFTTGQYIYFCWRNIAADSLDDYKGWVLAKIERDFNKKIFFDEERNSIQPNYQAIKLVFGL